MTLKNYNMGFKSHYFLFQTFILATLLDTPPDFWALPALWRLCLWSKFCLLYGLKIEADLLLQWFCHDDEHSDDQCSKNNTNQRLSSKSKIKWWKQSERPKISRESPLGTWAIKAIPSSKQIQLHSIPHTVKQARPASIVFGICCSKARRAVCYFMLVIAFVRLSPAHFFRRWSARGQWCCWMNVPTCAKCEDVTMQK